MLFDFQNCKFPIYLIKNETKSGLFYVKFQVILDYFNLKLNTSDEVEIDASFEMTDQ